jgi:RimJ/RimL family protein N-acetyltransferase
MITLESSILLLRPLSMVDLPDLLHIYQATPAYFLALGDDPTRLTYDHVIAQWHAAETDDRRQLFGVYLRSSSTLIGVADVQIGQPRPDVAGIWLLIGQAFQRHGYGQDCLGLLEGWLIPGQGVETICAICAEDPASIEFLALQGFQRTDQVAVTPIGAGTAFWMCW